MFLAVNVYGVGCRCECIAQPGIRMCFWLQSSPPSDPSAPVAPTAALRCSSRCACGPFCLSSTCRWGPFGSRAPLPPLNGPASPPPPPATNPAAAAAATAARRTHPLYATVSLQLLAEVINSRLFTTVRDSLGLTYDVSFEVSVLGWRLGPRHSCVGLSGAMHVFMCMCACDRLDVGM